VTRAGPTSAAAVAAEAVALAAVSVSVLKSPATSVERQTLFPSNLRPDGPYCVANALAPGALNKQSATQALNKILAASVQQQGRSKG
jgi:hypothetical protein